MRFIRPAEYASRLGISTPVLYKAIADGLLLGVMKATERASVVADFEVDIQASAVLAGLDADARRELVKLLKQARRDVVPSTVIRERASDFIREAACGEPA